jgi:hypothetical protein
LARAIFSRTFGERARHRIPAEGIHTQTLPPSKITPGLEDWADAASHVDTMIKSHSSHAIQKVMLDIEIPQRECFHVLDTLGGFLLGLFLALAFVYAPP